MIQRACGVRWEGSWWRAGPPATAVTPGGPQLGHRDRHPAQVPAHSFLSARWQRIHRCGGVAMSASTAAPAGRRPMVRLRHACARGRPLSAMPPRAASPGLGALRSEGPRGRPRACRGGSPRGLSLPPPPSASAPPPRRLCPAQNIIEKIIAHHAQGLAQPWVAPGDAVCVKVDWTSACRAAHAAPRRCTRAHPPHTLPPFALCRRASPQWPTS